MKKWLDKYDIPQAENGIEGTMGGLTDQGFNYNGAWGGQFQDGGSMLDSVKTKRVPLKEISKIPNKPERTDSNLENIVEIFDPTGITSWDDVYRSYQETGWSPSTALEVLGALPFLGKVGKVGKLAEAASKTFAITGRQKRNAKALAQTLKAISKFGPPAGRATDTYQAYEQWQNGGQMMYPMMQEGGTQYIDSVFNAKGNRDFNWVKRLYEKNPKTIQIPGQRYSSTHFMEYGDGRVYPTVVQMPSGKLQYLGNKARDYADSTKTYIQFPSDKEAKWFSENYKKGKGVLGNLAMGGSLPGAVGFTYARTQGAAPANGPYAKKTKASAENGMRFYQEGLDWKPKNISRNGSINNLDAQPVEKLDQLTNFTNYNKPTKGGWLSKYED